MEGSLLRYLFLSAAILIIFTQPVKASVWSSPNRWGDHSGVIDPRTHKNLTYEELYSDWISEDIDTDVFGAKGHLYQGRADCKQAIYILRAEFAYMHDLPFEVVRGAVSNRGNPKDQAYADLDRRYGTSKSPEKFQAFVKNILLRHVTLQTLSEDTYPISIDKKHLIPGTIVIGLKSGEPGVSNHSLTVTDTGPIKFINGSENDIRNPDRFSEPGHIDTWALSTISGLWIHPKTDQEGFRAWKHTDGTPDPSPDYAQFRSDFPMANPDINVGWGMAVEQRLDQGLIVEDEIYALAEDVCDYAQKRIPKVKAVKLYEEKYHLNSIRPGTEEFEELSTPTRDTFLRTKMASFETKICQAANGSLKDYWVDFKRDQNGNELKDKGGHKVFECNLDGQQDSDDNFARIKRKVFDSCNLYYGSELDQMITMEDFEELLLSDPNPKDSSLPHPISSDPNVSIEERWGIMPDFNAPSTTSDSFNSRRSSRQ